MSQVDDDALIGLGVRLITKTSCIFELSACFLVLLLLVEGHSYLIVDQGVSVANLLGLFEAQHCSF